MLSSQHEVQMKYKATKQAFKQQESTIKGPSTPNTFSPSMYTWPQKTKASYIQRMLRLNYCKIPSNHEIHVQNPWFSCEKPFLWFMALVLEPWTGHGKNATCHLLWFSDLAGRCFSFSALRSQLEYSNSDHHAQHQCPNPRNNVKQQETRMPSRIILFPQQLACTQCRIYIRNPEAILVKLSHCFTVLYLSKPPECVHV